MNEVLGTALLSQQPGMMLTSCQGLEVSITARMETQGESWKNIYAFLQKKTPKQESKCIFRPSDSIPVIKPV